MCESRMEAAMESYDNNNGDVPYKQRYKVAAALLYMIEKYKNGTARLMQRYPRGSYVKILFGAPAYKIFMEIGIFILLIRMKKALMDYS